MKHPHLWSLVLGVWCLFGAWDVVLGALAAQEQAWHYDAKDHCDPFFPLVQEGKSVSCEANVTTGGTPTGPLQLGGILWDPAGHSIALINDEEVKRGDRVDGYEVAEIRPDAVVLRRDGQSLVLQMTYEDQGAPPPADARGGSRGGKQR